MRNIHTIQNLDHIFLFGVFLFGALACDDGDGEGTEDLTPLDFALAEEAALDQGSLLDEALSQDKALNSDGAEEIDATLEPNLSFKVRPGVERIAVWGSEPNSLVQLLGPGGALLEEEESDELGSLLFRELSPGPGYALRIGEELMEGLTVLSVEGSTPDESFYAEQHLEPGFGYLKVRDGTPLSYFLSLPGPPEDGPYPTLLNYSGYSPSRPGQALGGAAGVLCGAYPILCDAPNFPSGLIMGLMGYAVMGVNVRGTGCSGGAYDYFDTPQLLDGYDVIEILARQPWVKHHKVGMVGLSFPGITQLFVASTRPPSLAAIAPMSVIADTASSTLAPGGIYNDGFAFEWITRVLEKAAPYAHRWIQERVDEGDLICEESQLLHGQRLDAIAKAKENPYYTDEVAAPIDPSLFVHQIDVPVFLVGQWQDEQTGPHFPALADKFSSSPLFRMTATNGVHMDGFAPQILAEWINFLSLYVDQEVPSVDSNLRLLLPNFMEQVFGAPLELPEARFAADNYEETRAAYEAESPIEIIFESGAPEEVAPGAPQGSFSQRFKAWPIPETQVSRWYLQPDGSLSETLPGPEGGASAFEHDPEAGERGTLASGSVNPLQPDWSYRPLIEGKALAFQSAPLEEDLVMVGHGSVDLWLRSTATDADLEVGLTELRPDGLESYVQMGWLRASHRALREDSTELRPVKSHREEDASPLVPGEWTEVRVELMPFAHLFRAGSRIRLSIDTPGDSMASWRFLLLEHDGSVTHSIGHSKIQPSSVALPLIPEVEVPTPLPECQRLRGQPCREYLPHLNQPAP